MTLARARRAGPAAALPRLDLHARRCRATALSTPAFKRRRPRAIEACEAAWRFYGGVFHVLIPDNTKAIVERRDPLEPQHHARLSRVRAGARLLHRSGACAQPAGQGARRAQCQLRPRRTASRGERPRDHRAGAGTRGRAGARREAGLRVHSRTQQRPREHFLEQEQAGSAAGADRSLRRPRPVRSEGRPRPARPGGQGALLAAAPLCRQGPACASRLAPRALLRRTGSSSRRIPA